MDEMISSINQAKAAFPDLRQVVFSGGECVMLGEDLFAAISHATKLKLSTRIVSNGYWGASANKAKKVAKRLWESGLGEINISTGRDHAEFVKVESALRAVDAAVNFGIFGLITVEQDAHDSSIVKQITESEQYINLMKLGENRFRFQINTWMQFTDSHVDRPLRDNPARPGPCQQLFSNIVVTPHKNISACCGLTYEHIPEMRIGNISEADGIKNAYAAEVSDFLKVWIHVDGPEGIVRKLYGDDIPPGLISKDHTCDTCARMHKCETTRELIRSRYQEFYPEVMLKHAVVKFVEKVAVQF